MNILNEIYELKNSVKESSAQLWEQYYSSASVVLSEISRTYLSDQQQHSLFGLYRGLCVSTSDPLQQNRVRFYCPLITKKGLTEKKLPFARPLSPFGGFDDSGVTWVPPAGSTLLIMFEGGNRNTAYYLGTTWSRSRGTNFGVPMEEFEKFHQGKRDGYIIGKNNEEVLPPWNTYNYNHHDLDDDKIFIDDPEVERKSKIPHAMGIKTAQKHRLFFDDGVYECNNKWKRVELCSGDGNYFIMKDDHLHTAGQYVHPDCGCGGGDLSDCTDQDDNPVEMTECEGQTSNSTIQGGHPDDQETQGQTTCANPNFKREEECRPYKGPQTPENNKCELWQSGFAIGSLSGHTILADDSVKEPRGEPGWKRATEPFDYGCNDQYRGKICIKESTGHLIELNGIEDEPEKKRRGEKNGLRFITATGNRLELLDHTVDDLAGSKRGVWLESSSTNHLYMVDGENDQKSPDRKSGGIPAAKATKAYVELKSGYGLELLMRDDNSQEETQNQFIRLMAPQRDNTERGPHILWMQEAAEGPGLVFLLVGGDFVGISYDNWLEVVGDPEKNPSSKIEAISDTKVEVIEETYFNKNKQTIFFADEFIALLAGDDCPPENDPCIGPVVVLNPSTGRIGLSTRVFASIKPDDDDVSIGMISLGF